MAEVLGGERRLGGAGAGGPGAKGRGAVGVGGWQRGRAWAGAEGRTGQEGWPVLATSSRALGAEGSLTVVGRSWEEVGGQDGLSEEPQEMAAHSCVPRPGQPG